MHKALIYILAMMMALTACSSSDTTEEPQPGQQKPTVLTIYVYSPENPLLTRADVGPVDATAAESKVTLLQIWVFDKNGKKVGALSTTETATLNGGEGAVYQIPVDDDFAKNKPNVDVYVLANIKPATCGVANEFTVESNLTDLQNKGKITTDHFGLSLPLTTTVSDDGLPMAGILKDQKVIGDAPVLRIGDQSHIATVSLTRAVSKLRFVFATTEGSGLSITDITLKAGMIPNEEYLFPQGQSAIYNTIEASLLPSTLTEVAEKDNPADYVYDGQKSAQEYETYINSAALTQVGPYYLRESDKQLEGTISYSVNGAAQTPATFRMREAGDFKRNHSWIVYAYSEGLSGMQVVTVDVTPWVERGGDHTVYNW